MSPPNPLENLSGPSGSLKAEPPDAAEISGLLRTGSTRLNDAISSMPLAQRSFAFMPYMHSELIDAA